MIAGQISTQPAHSGIETTRATSLPRLLSLVGVGFAVALFLGVGFVNIPHDATDAEMAAWWSDSGNTTSVVISGVLITLAALAFHAMIVTLKSRIDVSSRSGDILTQFIAGAGLISAVLMAASRLPILAIAVGMKRDDEPIPGTDLLRYFPQLGYAAMGLSVSLAGVTLLLLGLTAMRLPGIAIWFRWTSLILGAVLAVGGVVIGPLIIPVLLLWAVLFTVEQWRSQ